MEMNLDSSFQIFTGNQTKIKGLENLVEKDSKSREPKAHVGSIPTSGTKYP